MKTRVCVLIDCKVNEKFKKRFPCMLSRYVEKCMKDGLKDSSLVLNSVEKHEQINIFNIGLNK